MTDNIDKILEELYQGDPSLREHESALRQLVAELIELKPDTRFDEQFRQDLRRRLMSMAEIKEQNQPLINNFMKRFQLAGAGLALVALLAVSVWYLNGINTPSSNLTTLLSGPKITRSGSNAFGTLANVQAGGRGSGGGSESLSTPSTTPAADVPPGAGGGGDARLIAPEQPINYQYVYTGEELTLTLEQVEVLKRIKNESNSLSALIERVSLGLVNLNSFNNTQLQSFTFVEDRDKGYMVNVSLNEGSININENWPRWQQFTMPCPVDAPMGSSGREMISPCEPRRIDPSQVPSDEVLISAANSFVDSHGIPRANYGQPFVNNDWRIFYDRTADKANYWIPEIMNVVYPLLINGQTVYDESGNPAGMNVSVRIAPEVAVSSVWELTTQNYQSSAYQAETSVDRIMQLVAKGGFRNYYYSDPNGRAVEVELGTPEVSLVKLWNYRDGANEELLVPALIFPVTKQPADVESYWHRKNVVIPLVKEILDNEGGDVRIMPAGGGTGAAEPSVMIDPAPALKN